MGVRGAGHFEDGAVCGGYRWDGCQRSSAWEELRAGKTTSLRRVYTEAVRRVPCC